MLSHWINPALRAVLLGVVFSLPGCAPTHAPPKTDAQLAAYFRQTTLYQFNAVLAQATQAANRDDWVGELTVRVRINRKNELLGCTAEADPKIAPERFPDNAKLAALIENVCWNIILPSAEPSMFTSATAEELEIVQLLIFPDPSQVPEADRPRLAQKRLETQQSDAFWQQTFAGESIDSIGEATFRGWVDPQGNVLDCLAEIDLSLLRPQAFKPDPDLQRRLTERCKKMDMRQVSGFTLPKHEPTDFFVRVEYTPWKGTQKKAQFPEARPR